MTILLKNSGNYTSRVAGPLPLVIRKPVNAQAFPGQWDPGVQQNRGCHLPDPTVSPRLRTSRGWERGCIGDMLSGLRYVPRYKVFSTHPLSGGGSNSGCFHHRGVGTVGGSVNTRSPALQGQERAPAGQGSGAPPSQGKGTP